MTTLYRCWDAANKKHQYASLDNTCVYDECWNSTQKKHGVYCDDTFYPRCYNNTSDNWKVEVECCGGWGEPIDDQCYCGHYHFSRDEKYTIWPPYGSGEPCTGSSIGDYHWYGYWRAALRTYENATYGTIYTLTMLPYGSWCPAYNPSTEIYPEIVFVWGGGEYACWYKTMLRSRNAYQAHLPSLTPCDEDEELGWWINTPDGGRENASTFFSSFSFALGGTLTEHVEYDYCGVSRDDSIDGGTYKNNMHTFTLTPIDYADRGDCESC